MAFGHERLREEIVLLRRRGDVEEALLRSYGELDPDSIGHMLGSMNHDEAVSCVVMVHWWQVQLLQAMRDPSSCEDRVVGLDELLSAFSAVMRHDLDWLRVAGLLSSLGLVGAYDTTYMTASDVSCSVPASVADKLSAMAECARGMAVPDVEDVVGEDAVSCSSDDVVEPGVSESSEGLEASDGADVEDLLCGWPYVLRDERITREVLDCLGEQWVRRDGEVSCERVRLATRGYVDGDGEPLPESFEMDGTWLWDVGRNVIVPRCMKDATVQRERTKSYAEVFTPLDTVSRMVDAAEEAYLHGRDDEDGLLRIRAKAIEVACGEGPFLTSRYDPSTGEPIDDECDRVGIYDRKYRLAVSRYGIVGATDAGGKERHAASKSLTRVLRTTFGAEYQGDNLLIARANAYLTWHEAFERVLGKSPDRVSCRLAAETIALTIVQADVLTGEVPFSGGALSCMGFVKSVEGRVSRTEKVAVFAGGNVSDE